MSYAHDPRDGPAIRSDPPPGPPRRRSDPFAELVRRVAGDPDNPFNIEGYLWVLEESPPRACVACGGWFDAWVGYLGEAARGLPRRYCSTACRNRTWEARRRERWGSGRREAA